MTPRDKAIQYVSGLVASYRGALKTGSLGRAAVTFYHGRIKALTLELAELQIAGDESERRATRWCLVAAL